MQKLCTFKIILSVSLSVFAVFVNAQTPILLAPDNAPVESTVLSEYSGNFGIGIAQPSYKFHVKDGGIAIEQDVSNSLLSQIVFLRGNGNFQGKLLSGVDNNDDNFLLISTIGNCINCEPAIFINGSDKVGVKNSNPVATLDVIGTGKFTGLVEAAKLTVTDGEFTTTSTDGFSFGGTDLIIKPLGLIASGSGNSIAASSANSLVIGGNNTLSGTTPAHHLVIGSENEVSGKFGFIHGSSNVITAGYLAGFNYAMGKENTINFNQTIALDGFNYALGALNEIVSDSKTGLNYTIGGANKIDFTGFGSEGSGINFTIGAMNEIDVDLSASNDEHDIGINFISGLHNKITGESLGCFQSGVMLETNNALGAFTIGTGDFNNGSPLINNHSQSLMVGFGTHPSFFVQDNHVGINTATVNDAALRISSRDETGGTKLDIQAAGDEGWQNQIRFMDNSNNIRHLIADDFESNNLVIMPGYWNDGDPVANNILQVDGKMFVGEEQPNGTFTDYKLGVDGLLVAKRCVVQINQWADNVFEENYPLATLDEIELFIKQNKHLPEIPTEKEVLQSGVSLGEMNMLLLKKIEELTLHLIEHKKEIELLKSATAK